MIDITDMLKSVTAARTVWAIQHARDLLVTLRTGSSSVIDWDEDAGENWARMLHGDRPIALTWIPGPLLIVEVDEVSSITQAIGTMAIIITVHSLDAIQLACDPAQLLEVFGVRSESNSLDASAFSANDLWFATV